MSRRDARTVSAVLGRHAVVGPPKGHVAATLAAPTILDHGTPQQVGVLVRPIALGETSWCQLFSEPGAGSDLAGLGAKAERDGDEWVVTGQKVWNSAADVADMGMLLARTDPDQKKHGGITYFAIDMHQPGVEVRPLRVMSGAAPFCEVFLDEARVPAANVIGELNGGWRVARTTLLHERSAVVGRGMPGLVVAMSGSAHGDLDRTVGEVIERSRAAAAERTESDSFRRYWRERHDRAGAGAREDSRPGGTSGALPVLDAGEGERLDDASDRRRRRDADRR